MLPLTTLQLVDAAPLVERLEKIETLLTDLTRGGGTASTEPEYLPLRKLAARYGMSPQNARLYTAAAVSAGQLRVIRPLCADGVTHGNTLYHVEDFRAWLAREGAADT